MAPSPALGSVRANSRALFLHHRRNLRVEPNHIGLLNPLWLGAAQHAAALLQPSAVISQEVEPEPELEPEPEPESERGGATSEASAEPEQQPLHAPERDGQLAGIMIGRAAFHSVWRLACADTVALGADEDPATSRRQVVRSGWTLPVGHTFPRLMIL
eukprot:SAG11_NODE_1685_length_4449_cov_4.411954_4_plen_158_part_00